MSDAKLINTLQKIRDLADETLREINDRGPRAKNQKLRTPQSASSKNGSGPSFNTNVLAFMKKHAANLSGPKKFTLLLAYMTKGHTSQEVSLAALEKRWNKMKAVLGGKFNGAYVNRAKASGWIDTPKRQIYTLDPSWKDCLSSNA